MGVMLRVALLLRGVVLAPVPIVPWSSSAAQLSFDDLAHVHPSGLATSCVEAVMRRLCMLVVSSYNLSSSLEHRVGLPFVL